MGNQLSYEPVDDSVEPRALRARSLEGIAEYIKSDRCNNIAVMVGAGISTSAGIPDFRSPDTGIYTSLAHLNIQPEAVFDISFFRENPLPFYTLAHELYPGKYRPTVTHSFIRLLHEKGKLRWCYTQNIDTLERMAGVPDYKIIEAHGSFANQRCIECKTPFPENDMKVCIAKKEIPYCQIPNCNGYVKPDIVFFGEPLPPHFSASLPDLTDNADMGIVMGTSLTVFPFAALPLRIKDGNPRLLINQEQVGEVGSRSDDYLLIGDCDYGVRRLCDALGWRDDLEALWEQTKLPEDIEREEREKNMTAEQRIEAELNRIATDVEASLKRTERHKERVRATLESGDKSKSQTPEMDEFNKMLQAGVAAQASTTSLTGSTSGGAPAGPTNKSFFEPDSPTLGGSDGGGDEGDDVDDVGKKLGERLNITDPDVASTTPKINTPGVSTPIVDPDKTVNVRDKSEEGSGLKNVDPS